MNRKILIYFLFCFYLRQLDASDSLEAQIGRYQDKIDNWLKYLDAEYLKYQSSSASLNWKLQTVPTKKAAENNTELEIAYHKWTNKLCAIHVKTHWLRYDQKRKLYLFCRGAVFDEALSRSYQHLMQQLEDAYSSEICLTENDSESWKEISLQNSEVSKLIYPELCVQGEPDLETMIQRTDLNADQRKWIWKKWYDFLGPKIKVLYPSIVHEQNIAAQNNGYADMGAVWRESYEIPDLPKDVINFYNQIKPLYALLHAVVRQKLWQKYGPLVVDLTGPIPIHLLGNMWGQDWSTLISLIIPENETINLQKNLDKNDWTILDMVHRSEEMYTSIGLPPMTEKFWKSSIFEKSPNITVCHGTAYDMFKKDDFRMSLCATKTMENFYIIHHEMGHIEYYMAYQAQPTIFKDATNLAFTEAIGEAILHGVTVPQHLYRLGLIDDNKLIDDKNLDRYILLQKALLKLPELAFGLVIDKYRWDIFEGKIKPENYNKAFWELNRHFRGIAAPEQRGEEYFDAGAKFHVAYNIDYIRYFLSDIIQLELFDGLCDLALFGKPVDVNDAAVYRLPLHRCDIYGAKKAGEALRKMMEIGASEHWSKALKVLTGKEYISTKSYLDYYNPLYLWLQNYVKINQIPIGW